MNSIPMISHHLFVAAVKHEGRDQERPRRRTLSSTEMQVGTSREMSCDATAEASVSAPHNLGVNKNRSQV